MKTTNPIILLVDCPWGFEDPLKHSDVKRSAQSQYPTLDLAEIKKLPIKALAGDNAILGLWVPSSMLQDGLDVMNAWGFEQKQTVIWVKTKKNPVLKVIADVLGFGMGRLFRQAHEIVLFGTRGKVYDHLENRSQRSVHFGPVTVHSAKPEDLHESLEKMFPKSKKYEIFARRNRKGWTCLGNDAPDTVGEDIRDSLKRIIPKKKLEEFEKELETKESQRQEILNKIKNSLNKEEQKIIRKLLK